MVRQVAGNSRALISRSSQRHPTRMMITTPSFARTTRIFVGINPCLGIFDPFFSSSEFSIRIDRITAWNSKRKVYIVFTMRGYLLARYDR